MKNQEITTQAREEQNIANKAKGKRLISEINLEQEIVYVNRSFRDLLGFTKETISNKGIEDIIHEDIPLCLLERAFSVADKGGTWKGLIKFKSNRNEYLWGAVIVRPLMRNNKQEGYSIIQRDADKTLIPEISERYKDIIETGENRFFCGPVPK